MELKDLEMGTKTEQQENNSEKLSEKMETIIKKVTAEIEKLIKEIEDSEMDNEGKRLEISELEENKKKIIGELKEKIEMYKMYKPDELERAIDNLVEEIKKIPAKEEDRTPTQKKEVEECEMNLEILQAVKNKEL